MSERKIRLNKQMINELERKWSEGKGTSRHDVKTLMTERHGETYSPYIHAQATLKTYKEQTREYGRWCAAQGIKDMTAAKAAVGEYLTEMIKSNRSAYTINTAGASLAKVFSCRINDFKRQDGSEVMRPERHRNEITRSRYAAERDRHVSVTQNEELIKFCRATGVRRHEIDANGSTDERLHAMRGTYIDEATGERKSTVYEKDGRWFVHITGKGGKSREAPVIGDKVTVDAVVKRIQMAGNGRVWQHVHSKLDIHALRSQYACDLYKLMARDVNKIPTEERYYCRKDMAGRVYDRKAMLIVSRALGHERICVIADHYLYNL